MDTRTTGVQVPGTWKARPKILHGAAEQSPCPAWPLPRRLHPAPSACPGTPAPALSPSDCPGAPRPAQGRSHRCARRSPEPALGVGVPFASGGETGARKGQWQVCIAPPLPSDWSAPESRGRGLGRRAAVGLNLSVADELPSLSSACLRACRVSRRLRHGPVSDGPQAPGQLSDGQWEERSRPDVARAPRVAWTRPRGAKSPGPPGSQPPRAWAPELPATRASLATSPFPGPSSLPLGAARGGSRFLERAGRGPTGRGKPESDVEGRPLDGQRLCQQRLFPAMGEGVHLQQFCLPDRLELACCEYSTI